MDVAAGSLPEPFRHRLDFCLPAPLPERGQLVLGPDDCRQPGMCRLLVRPGDLQSQLLRYWDPDTDLAATDLERLEGTSRTLQCQPLDVHGEQSTVGQALHVAQPRQRQAASLRTWSDQARHGQDAQAVQHTEAAACACCRARGSRQAGCCLQESLPALGQGAHPSRSNRALPSSWRSTCQALLTRPCWCAAFHAPLWLCLGAPLHHRRWCDRCGS